MADMFGILKSPHRPNHDILDAVKDTATNYNLNFLVTTRDNFCVTGSPSNIVKFFACTGSVTFPYGEMIFDGQRTLL